MTRALTDLQGIAVCVTGGTRGIGRASVLEMVARGARVAFQGRDAAAGDGLMSACADLPGEAVFVRGDVSSFDDARSLAAEATKRWERLDVWVSSGGPREPRPKLFTDLASPAESLAMIESRLKPRLNGIHAAVPEMRKLGFGKIILLGTDAARTPTPSESMVGAAGASLMFLTRALAKELAVYGIRLNTVATTITAGTPPYEAYLAAKASMSNEVLVKAFTKAHEKAAFGVNKAEDLAQYIAFLASPASDQISGSTLSINGGLSFPSY